ncbi:MAG: M15 family metallopeptidase [Clostridium sp.]
MLRDVQNRGGNQCTRQQAVHSMVGGIAFDFYLIMDIDGDGSTSDDAFNDRTGMFKKAAEIAKGLGLAWGGDWKSLEDKPHLYLPDWGSGTNILKQRYGTFERKKTWPKMDVAPVKADSDAGAAESQGHQERRARLESHCILAHRIRTAPAGAEAGKRYSKDQQVQPIRKCFVSSTVDADCRTAGCLTTLLGWVCPRTGVGGSLLEWYTYPAQCSLPD